MMRWFARLLLFLFLVSGVTIEAKSLVKRQAANGGGLLGQAFGMIRPFLDFGRRSSPRIRPTRLIQDDTPRRPAAVLGIQPHTSLDDVPICKDDSAMCRFIACTTKNLHNDHSLANLNFAAQVLGDRELRQSISGDPGLMQTACGERSLNPTQCRLFSDGFKLVDRFMTAIEDSARDRHLFSLDRPSSSLPINQPTNSRITRDKLEWVRVRGAADYYDAVDVEEGSGTGDGGLTAGDYYDMYGSGGSKGQGSNAQINCLQILTG